MGKIITLASRLAESILMDWDKEDVIKLAKEVAVACHDEINFISLVKRMREAQKRVVAYNIFEGVMKYKELWADALKDRMKLESEVDEYLEKLEK